MRSKHGIDLAYAKYPKLLKGFVLEPRSIFSAYKWNRPFYSRHIMTTSLFVAWYLALLIYNIETKLYTNQKWLYKY